MPHPTLCNINSAQPGLLVFIYRLHIRIIACAIGLAAFAACWLVQFLKTNTRGRVRAGPSLQLGTLSTRIANLLCIIHSALSRLDPAVFTHGSTAAVRHTYTVGPGGPLRGQTD